MATPSDTVAARMDADSRPVFRGAFAWAALATSDPTSW
jgi:hypothetical protein